MHFEFPRSFSPSSNESASDIIICMHLRRMICYWLRPLVQAGFSQFVQASFSQITTLEELIFVYTYCIHHKSLLSSCSHVARRSILIQQRGVLEYFELSLQTRAGVQCFKSYVNPARAHASYVEFIFSSYGSTPFYCVAIEGTKPGM